MRSSWRNARENVPRRYGQRLGEVQRVARALLCLGVGSILAVVLLDEITRPFAGIFRVALEEL